MSIFNSKKTFLMATAAGLAMCATAAYAEPDAQAGTSEADAAASGPSGFADILVTARRKSESAQDTPVSVTVLDSAALESRGVKELRELTSSIPGVNFTHSAASFNATFSIRGLTKSVVGNSQAAVATYVNDVPLGTFGSSVPTYDISSVQVLKGPQGTLFGRNTIAGAVLIGTGKPSYDFGGYVTGTFGEYDWRTVDGAVNVPIVDGKVALRVAGELARRDGYTKNLSIPGQDYDDVHRDGVRVSLLLDPFEGLSNTLVYEKNKIDEVGTGVVFNLATPDGNPFLAPLTSFLEARANAEGRRVTRSDMPSPHTTGETETIINTTTFDLGPVTLKNIFGYRTVGFDSQLDIDGSEFALINATRTSHTKQISDEFQIAGSAFSDNLSYILGVFYVKEEPDGEDSNFLQFFQAPGTPFFSPFDPTTFTGGAFGNGSFVTSESRAIFGQTSLKLGALSDSLSKFTLDAGVRYTEDKQNVCYANMFSVLAPRTTQAQCEAGGSFLIVNNIPEQEDDALTYTLGLNYQAARDVLIYGVTRKGYRAGGINPPLLGGSLASFRTYEPETVTDYELGMKSQWAINDMDLKFNIAGYVTKDNRLQFGIPTSQVVSPAGPDGDFNPLNDPAATVFIANLGKATIKGVEAEFGIKPTDNLEINLGLNWASQSGKQNFVVPATLGAGAVTPESIKRFAFYGAPTYGYTADVTYTLPLSENIGEVALKAHYFKSSEVHYGTLDASPETLDVRADWRNIFASNVDAGVFVNNVTDELWATGAGVSPFGLGFNSATYNEPRIVGVQVKYNFGAK